MAEVNVESVEIDLEPLEDSTTTNFSDNEQIPVEHVNFEFEQVNKLHGVNRHFTVFNDTHLYQSIKIKHQRKYKFRIDLAYLDPRPFRIRVKAWKWLYLSLALLGLDAALFFSGWLDTFSLSFFGAFTAITVGAIVCLLAFFYNSHDKVFFRTQYGKIRLVELVNKNPDNAGFRRFVNKFIMQIKKCKTAKGLNQNKFLARELRELRRLKDEAIIPTGSYEKAKQLIFKHKAFNAADQ
jgi:hypothetical protein